jgi:hypothetical protein
VRQQLETDQPFERGFPVPGQHQLQRFVEQPRRRHAVEHVGELADRGFSARMQREAEFRCEARSPQHAHRVFTVARRGIADHAQDTIARVLDAAHVIPDRVILDVVVERVGGEIAAPHVFFDRAVEVVAQDAAVLVDRAMLGFIDAMVFVHLGVCGAERRHLDDLVAEAHVRQVKPAADQAAIAECLADIFRMRIGRDVEILGLDVEQQIAHRAADQEALVAGILEAVENLERGRRDVGAGDVVLAAGVDPGLRRAGLDSGLGSGGRGLGVARTKEFSE